MIIEFNNHNYTIDIKRGDKYYADYHFIDDLSSTTIKRLKNKIMHIFAN